MYYIGIDPGAKFTGIAIIDSSKNEKNEFVFHREYDDPVHLFCDLLDFGVLVISRCRIAIEDMLGSGRRDDNIVRTIKVLGYLENRLREYGIIYTCDLVVELVPQQARLAYVSLVPKNITGKDEISAAAHALALRERSKLCSLSRRSLTSPRHIILRVYRRYIRALGCTVTTTS